MLKKRIITATIAIPIVLAVIWWLPPLIFAVLMLAIIGWGAWEWSQLVGISLLAWRAIYVLAVILSALIANFLPVFFLLGIGFIFCLWLIPAILLYERSHSAFGWQFPLVRAIGGLFLLLAFWVACITLKADPYFGPIWLIYLFITVIVADSTAYFVGKYFGQKKLAIHVSPNKTWLGFWSGIAVAFLVGVGMNYLFFIASFDKRLGLWLLTLLTILGAVIGDLAMSLCKRLVGVKDTGNVFPGHGGMLDRIDALMVASIVFVLGLLFIA